MNDGTPLSSYDSEMASKAKKNRRSTFEKRMKTHCYSLKAEDYVLFKNMPQIPAILLRPLKSMLNSEVNTSNALQ